MKPPKATLRVTRSSSSRRWSGPRIALLAFAGIAAAYASALYLESFVLPDGCCFATWPHPNPIQVERLLEKNDSKGLSPDLQEKAARQVLAARPVDPSGWLRLAYADALRNGKLTRQGLYAFKTSYTMSAYAASNAGWRVAFGLDHWYELDAETKEQVLTELRALSKDDRRREGAKVQIGRITNPLGRYEAYRADMLPPPEPPSKR